MLVECSDCEAIVNGELIANYVNDDDDGSSMFLISLLKCPKCGLPILVVQGEDDLDDTVAWGNPVRLYPPKDRDVSPTVPGPIRLSYEEAQRCFKAKAYTATAIMCRKTLEGLVQAKGVTAGSLDSALKKMKDEELSRIDCMNGLMRFEYLATKLRMRSLQL